MCYDPVVMQTGRKNTVTVSVFSVLFLLVRITLKKFINRLASLGFESHVVAEDSMKYIRE